MRKQERKISKLEKKKAEAGNKMQKMHGIRWGQRENYQRNNDNVKDEKVEGKPQESRV